MSLSTTTNRSDRTLNGVATVFSFDFKVFAETDLEVTLIDQTTEVETVLTLGVDYTVSGVNADAGSITLVAGPGTSGDRLIIKRVMDIVQPTRLRNQGDFFPATHERAFDRSIMIDQQQQEEIDRSFKLSKGASGGVTATPVPGYALGFDASGNLTSVPNTGADQTAAWTAADAVVAADAAAATVALKESLETNGYVLDQSGVASIAIVPTGFAQSMGIQSTVNNSASRLYIVPKGSPTGATGTLKIFATDYIADSTNYRDLGIYYETTNAEFRINSKYNGTPGSPAPVYFTTMDGAYIAGGFYQGANYAGMVLGGRIPAGVTYYASVPTIFTASAVFLNNTLLRWYRADGVGVGHGVRFNASNQYEVLNDGSVVLRCTSAYTEVTGALLTDLLVGTAGQATPSVAGTSFLQVPTNGAGYNITDFIGASQGQRLTVLFSDNKPTLVNSAGLRLAGAVNFTGSAGSTISFIRGSSGWFETCRSVN